MRENFLAFFSVFFIIVGSIIMVDEHHRFSHSDPNQFNPTHVHNVEQENWVNLITVGAIGYLLGDR